MGAFVSPAAQLLKSDKLMVDHKIIVPPGGILFPNGAKIGGAL
jgi:hypothetical protein